MIVCRPADHNKTPGALAADYDICRLFYLITKTINLKAIFTKL